MLKPKASELISNKYGTDVIPNPNCHFLSIRQRNDCLDFNSSKTTQQLPRAYPWIPAIEIQGTSTFALSICLDEELQDVVWCLWWQW